MTRPRTALLPGILVTSLILAACGSEATSASASEPDATLSIAVSEPAASASQPGASETADVRVRIPELGLRPDRADGRRRHGGHVPQRRWLRAYRDRGDRWPAVDGSDRRRGDRDQNGSVSVTFDEPGTYNITCTIHPVDEPHRHRRGLTPAARSPERASYGDHDHAPNPHHDLRVRPLRAHPRPRRMQQRRRRQLGIGRRWGRRHGWGGPSRWRTPSSRHRRSRSRPARRSPSPTPRATP